MKLKATQLIQVYFQHFGEKTLLGRLLLYEGQILFEYEAAFLQKNLAVSPFHLPLKSGVQTGKVDLFEGLPGLFNDSLPDGWGKLLIDRAVLAKGIPPQQLSPLDRLAYVGKWGMGALSYEPELSEKAESEVLDLDKLAHESALILKGDASEILNHLVEMGGSSAGARPKVLLGYHPTQNKIISGQQELPIGYEHWMIKFPSSLDLPDIALIELAYAQMAKAAGLEMSESKVVEGISGQNYFATKRFDRLGNKRIHVHTACGLLNADHRFPSLDYENLMRAALSLCKDVREVEKVFRLAVFNVFAHNRDDHSKNFSFIMDANGKWAFAPAYDLTFSYGPGGEHSSMVMGEGRDAGTSQLLRLAEKFQITKALQIIEQIKEAVNQWQKIAQSLNVGNESLKIIKKQIDRQLKR